MGDQHDANDEKAVNAFGGDECINDNKLAEK